MGAHFYLDAVLGREPVLPADRLGRLIQVVLIAIGGRGNAQEDATRDAGLQVRAIAEGECASKRDTSGRSLDCRSSQVLELIGQHSLEPAWAGCKKVAVCGIHSLAHISHSEYSPTPQPPGQYIHHGPS